MSSLVSFPIGDSFIGYDCYSLSLLAPTEKADQPPQTEQIRRGTMRPVGQ